MHIPKTAGQSVHRYLVDGFKKESVCPLRVDAQYEGTNLDLDSFQVHSGHIDWARLERLTGEKIVFTILRRPIDRILSYYFYLRKEALLLTEGELLDPSRAGMNAALNLTPDEYFSTYGGEIRSFIDDHYDNFYTYFFAGKTYNSRRALVDLKSKELISLAIKNLSNIAVYTVDRWTDVSKLIGREFEGFKNPEGDYFVNKGDSYGSTERLDKLKELGATNITFDRLGEMTKLDNIIFDLYSTIERID